MPADLAHLDPRRFVRVTLKTRDIAKARSAAALVTGQIDTLWGELYATGLAPSPDASAAFERAVQTARSLKLSYVPAGALAKGDLAALVGRLELLERQHLTKTAPAYQAVLGGVAPPAVMLSALFLSYEGHARDRLRGKSPGQVRKWRNPRRRAVANAVAVIGDKPLDALARSDGLDFRAWWIDRVADEDLHPGSANKDLQHLTTMFGALNDAWRLDLANPFSGLALSGGRHTPRTAYAAAFVRDNFLTGDRLASLNAEARAIVGIVARLGMRPSEVCGLTAPHIRLSDNIPVLQVRAVGRQIKTRSAARDLPLSGCALEIMRRFPDGFPRYRDAPDSLSAAVNKALGAAGLRPTDDHTLYSLRHTFMDRLIKIEAPQRVQDALMGHSVKGEEYGAGPDLEQKALWLARVWG